MHPWCFRAVCLVPLAFCLLLSACEMTVTVTQPTATPAPPTLLWSDTLTLVSAPDPVGGQRRLLLPIDRPGRYTLVLTQANPSDAGRWIIWDYLGLHQGAAPLWAIGELEAPSDQSQTAFDEFCTRPDAAACTGDFTVGATRAGQFTYDLNDSTRPRATITFDIGAQQAAADLELVISTLYATHDLVAGFKLKVELLREP